MTDATTDDAREHTDAPVPERRQLGRYALRYRLAQGGMASVHLAQLAANGGFRKWVAVKVVHPHLAADRGFARMFRNEAQLTARLHHPNVCNVFDAGEADGTPYLAMEYLHGETAAALARRAWAPTAGGIPPTIAARIAADAAAGLHAAHELRGADGTPAGVVHRDVSPQNLFVLYNGVTKLVDFGIARSSEFLAERTETGHLRGKLAYMAPEQVRRRPIDRRTDVFALGIVLWELSTGHRLFRREDQVTTITAVLRDPILSPSRLVQNYPLALEQIVMRALSREPAKRFATAGDFAAALEVYLASTGVPSGPAAVADFVGKHFADAIVRREALLAGELGDRVTSEDTDRGAVEATPPTQLARAASRRTSLLARTAAGVGLIVLGIAAGVVAQALRAAPTTSAAPPVRTIMPPARPIAATSPSTEPSRATTVFTSPIATTPQAPLPPVTTPPLHTATVTRASTAASPRRRRTSTASTASVIPPGYLDLLASPSAAVTEGGRRIGHTPLVHAPLAPGRHVLRLDPGGDRAPRTVTVQIRAGATASTTVRWP